MEHTVRQFEFMPVTTLTARLRGIGGINLDNSLASFFRFAIQKVKEHAPRCIPNAFVKAVERLA